MNSSDLNRVFSPELQNLLDQDKKGLLLKRNNQQLEKKKIQLIELKDPNVVGGYKCRALRALVGLDFDFVCYLLGIKFERPKRAMNLAKNVILKALGYFQSL